MFKLNTGPARPISQPEDSAQWAQQTPNVQREHAKVPTEPTTQHGDALGEREGYEPPSARIPRSKLELAGERIAQHIHRQHKGVDFEAIHAITRKSEGESWVTARNREHKATPLKDLAAHKMNQHFRNGYGR